MSEIYSRAQMASIQSAAGLANVESRGALGKATRAMAKRARRKRDLLNEQVDEWYRNNPGDGADYGVGIPDMVDHKLNKQYGKRMRKTESLNRLRRKETQNTPDEIEAYVSGGTKKLPKRYRDGRLR